MQHLGGRKNICPACFGTKACLFYNATGKLTRYAFLCGYVEVKGNFNLHMRHGVYHMQGFRPDNSRVWESFDTVGQARKYMSQVSSHRRKIGDNLNAHLQTISQSA